MSRLWSLKEMSRINTIERYLLGQISREQAAETLHLSLKQISRLKKRMQANGPDGLRHAGLGRYPKNKLSTDVSNKILEVFLDWKRRSDDGVNASHLADILLRDHGIRVSRQTTWRLLKSRGFIVRTRRVRKHRKKRDRRAHEGDLLYLDGSPHRWFGEKHPQITLVICTDDATTKVLAGKFVPEENRNVCFEVTYEVTQKYGLPNSFWLDRASQFITTRKGGLRSAQRELPTHWQDAMYKLGIRCIFAHSPQARGRGERVNGTFQERLCAELQYRSISDLKTANEFLSEVFIPEYNQRFAVQAKEGAVWRKPPERIEMRGVLCARTERRVLNDNTIKHCGRRFQLLKHSGVRTFAGKTLEIQEWFDGTIHVFSPCDYTREYSVEEIHQEPRHKRISGITDQVHHTTLVSHVYY